MTDRNKLKPRRSYTASSVPLVADLEENEMAVNWTDGKVFVRRNNAIVTLTMGGSGGGSLSGSVTIPAIGDTDRPDTLLLARFDNDAADSGPLGQSVTIGGSAAVSSTTKKYGTGSAYFPAGNDTTNNVINYGSGATWDVMKSDFTIEAWLYATSVPNYSGVICRDDQDTRRNWQLLVSADGNKPLAFGVFNSAGGSFASIVDSTGFPLNQWVHVAVVRDSGVFRMYRNGVQVGSVAASSGNGTISTASGPLSVGALNENGAYGFNGYIDEVRVLTKCIYPGGTTFTPPTSAVTTFYAAPQTLPVVFS